MVNENRFANLLLPNGKNFKLVNCPVRASSPVWEVLPNHQRASRRQQLARSMAWRRTTERTTDNRGRREAFRQHW